MTSWSSDPPGPRIAGQRGLLTHCRRVGAVAAELAQRLGLTVRDREVLADAALVHHYPAELLSTATIGSVLTIVERQCGAEPHQMDPVLRRRRLTDLLTVLTGFHSLSLNQRGNDLAGVLRTANFVVDRLESPPTEVDPRDAVFDALRRKASEGLISSNAFRAYTSLPRPRREDLSQAVARLPVYPKIALRVLALTATDQVSFPDLAGLVSQDQALAVHLIGAANSCMYSPVGQISSIGHAMSYIGLEETRRIITAASLRPLFASSGVAELWKHSIRMSRACEDLSAQVSGVRKDEAFLVGLVHDAGRLLALKHAGEASLTFVRLLERGCDPAFAEVGLFGCDHAGLGAEVLRIWKFPEHLVDAVLHHHHPERSDGPLASLLYLGESREPAEQAEQSADTLEYAARKTGLAQESVEVGEPDIGLLRWMSA